MGSIFEIMYPLDIKSGTQNYGNVCSTRQSLFFTPYLFESFYDKGIILRIQLAGILIEDFMGSVMCTTKNALCGKILLYCCDFIAIYWSFRHTA